MTAQASMTSAVSLGNNTNIAFHSVKQDLRGAARQRKYELQDIMAELLPNDRVAWCLKHRQSAGGNIEIVYDVEQQRAYYGNLLVCGNTWTCPVCAARITEQRRQELSAAIEKWRAGGGGVFMAAFTLQHSVDDILFQLRRTLNSAYRTMTARKGYAWIRQAYGIVGSVASLEVTHSFRHGWHPHRHVLFFTEKEMTDKDIFDIQAALSTLWRSVLVKCGRYADGAAGVVLSNGDNQAGDYVCKWSIAHEMTKSPVKAGRDGGFSPFELAELWHETHDQRYAHLVKEYAHAFFRSKQLTYSPAIPAKAGRPAKAGMRELLGIQDKSDQQLAAEQQAAAVKFAELDQQAWKRVYIRRWRGLILRAASTGKQDQLADCLKQLGIDAAETADDGHVIYMASGP